MPKALAGFGIVITTDDRFIILFGGFVEDEIATTDIYVFDTKFLTFYQSNLICPEAARYHAVIMANSKRDNLLCSDIFGIAIKWINDFNSNRNY